MGYLYSGEKDDWLAIMRLWMEQTTVTHGGELTTVWEVFERECPYIAEDMPDGG